ncbi:MAG: hypothetical protein FD189_2242 [Elusimicrobia bacterium]|nr:MAG: hypothetical protein FD154_1679 [Elusimicrobiota bacterium]KAF0153836.1 MAG: hypothetical protein FD189_2242 [Elusimicrobiota bacterium]
MKFSVYSLWTDPYFYLAAVGLGLGLFLLIYSIRRYLELANRSELEDEPLETAPAQETPQGELFSAPAGDEPAAEVPAEAPAEGYAEEPSVAQEQAPEEHSPAETFVMGIYESLKSLDARMGKLENKLGAERISSEFTVKFLEDILSDLDSLDKEKIKGRLEYLVSDLKRK